ncbi:hypothetical protein P3T76_012188 [Phytophthora citrophthora]|uniref:Uncharacterized protein n=1 Tax=Phytophthora citrophthora TaxID=4793 RepID=A0AAD9LEF3_9STRA|nr:hypothetical protein P3T76_012188 [Phytophthora citrophthora]
MKWSDPLGGGHTRQAPCLPDYSPSRYDVKILKSRAWGMDRQLQNLLLAALWNDVYSQRPQELYFHTRDDLDEEALDALYDWTNFVAGDSRAFWHTYQWLTLDGLPSAPSSIRKAQDKRTNVYAVSRKRAMALLTRVKSRLPDSIWFEPGVWNFSSKLCHWILMDLDHLNPSTGHPYILEEQLELLDSQEPGRAQWVNCATDEERVAHVPDELRAKLIPAGHRIQFPDLWGED